MLHIITGTVIFFGCAYLVFSKRINDGFIGRHMLTFAAIAGAGFAYSGELRALLAAYVLMIGFVLWFALRKVVSMADA